VFDLTGSGQGSPKSYVLRCRKRQKSRLVLEWKQTDRTSFVNRSRPRAAPAQARNQRRRSNGCVAPRGRAPKPAAATAFTPANRERPWAWRSDMGQLAGGAKDGKLVLGFGWLCGIGSRRAANSSRHTRTDDTFIPSADRVNRYSQSRRCLISIHADFADAVAKRRRPGRHDLHAFRSAADAEAERIAGRRRREQRLTPLAG